MKFHKILISSLLTFTNISQLALAQTPTDFTKGIHKFLANQRNFQTGILESFINSDDGLLKDQASTYDLALAGLGFLQLKDVQSAERILNFFNNRWSGTGFPNFYNTKTGSGGIENTVHLGPNMWVAVLALQYTQITGKKNFEPLIKNMADWATKLHHEKGAISMGPYADWGANWPRVYGAESNVVAYSVFRYLSNIEKDHKLKVSYELEMQGIRDFLKSIVLIKDEEGTIKNIVVGFSEQEGVSSIPACDVVSMILLTFTPQELQEFFSITPQQLIDFADQKFKVNEDGIQGFDYTEKQVADAAKRPRMISLEWTMQMACALQGSPQAEKLVEQVDQKMISFKGMYFYPYATKASCQVFSFAPWWKTPPGHPSRCGSMASTMWRVFYSKNFNPLI